ncbi:MAG TPA: MFS transporter [Acidimicrobiales bacterium]|nr:MFS transporter [Acidimicrobiales bacterium]
MRSTFRALRQRNARLFFSGLVVSNVGTWMQLTALAVLMYRLTGKGTDLGILVVCQWGPMLVLGAWAGAFADRHDRLTLTRVMQVLLALQSLTLGALVLAGWADVPVVLGLSFALGLLNAFDNPARRGFVTELVEADDIPNVVSLNTAVMTGSRVFGPALAALLVETVDVGWCFVLNGLSYGAILLALAKIDRAQLQAMPRAAKGGTPVRDALRFVAAERRLLLVFVVMVVVSTFAFNYPVALPLLGDERWGGESAFGWVLAITGAGSVVGSLIIASRRTVGLRWYLGSVSLVGVSAIALAWAPSLAVAAVLAVPLGIGGAGFVTSANAISQQMSPPDMRSRLLALTAVAFLGSTPVGGPITGWIADTFGASWSLAYGGFIALACVAVAAIVLRVRLALPAEAVPVEAVPAEAVPVEAVTVESGTSLPVKDSLATAID